MKKTLVVFIFAVLAAGFFLPSFAQTTTNEIKVVAHRTERVEGRIFASGNVEIHYKDILLLADSIEVDTETKDVYAEGNVSLHLPREVLTAESLRFNLNTQTGEIKDAYGMIQPTIFYKADSMEKKDDNIYSLSKADITSCTQPVPRWKFSCAKANFKKDDFVEMWSALMRIKKIPVFYVPYLRYPLGEERRTGFLMPQLGYSGVKGMVFSQGFYLNIRRNMDATLNFDYFSARGLGGGMEYRYLFREGIGGNLKFFYFRFKENEMMDEAENAYIFRFKHNQPLPFQFNLVADIDYQSSFDFLREFDNDVKRALISNRSSQVHLSRSWSYYNFSFRFSRFETFYRELDNSRIRYLLPQVSFSSSRMELVGPLYFSFSSSFVRWEYGFRTAFERDNQTKSQSLGFYPTLSLPVSSIPWLTMKTDVTANFNYHFSSFFPNTNRVTNEPIFSQNYVFNTEFVGPVFSRVFFSRGKPWLKHIIEPSFTYVYETPVADADRIITTSYFRRSHYLRYSLTNRILVKQDGSPREVFTLGVSQNYYLSPEDSPLQRYRVNGEIPKFSDISGYLRFYPAKNYSLDLSAGFNPYFTSFSSLRVGAGLGAPTDSFFLRLNWYKSINPYRETVLSNRHQIGVQGGAKIPLLNLEAQGQLDFNIQKRELLYLGGVLVYHYQCLDFSADLKVFYFREKPEVQFRFTIGLGSIGKTTDILGGLGNL
ncbi:MAG: LPS-assembly protein LptD [Acidobacteriota bacterium]